MGLKKTRKNVFIVYFISVICFILLLTGSYINLRKADVETDKLKKAMEDFSKIQNIALDIESIESGQRGFIISGNSDFLNSYYKGLIEIKKDTSFLSTSFSDSLLSNHKAELIELINKKIAFTNKIIAFRKEFGSDSSD